MVASDLVDMHELQQRPNPWRKRERHTTLRRERAGLLNSSRQALQGFRGSPRERAFVRGTSGERELGVQGLRVRFPLVNFFFHSEVCMPRGGEPFVADPRILIVFSFVLFLLSSYCIVWY